MVVEPDSPGISLYHQRSDRLPYPLELLDPPDRIDGVEPEPWDDGRDRLAGLPHVLVAYVRPSHRCLRRREVIVVHKPAGTRRPAQEDLEEVLVPVFMYQAPEVE